MFLPPVQTSVRIRCADMSQDQTVPVDKIHDTIVNRKFESSLIWNKKWVWLGAEVPEMDLIWTVVM